MVQEQTSWLVYFCALFASIGGLIFGFDVGSISGLLNMQDSKDRFGDVPDKAHPGHFDFGDFRTGIIVGAFSVGTFLGCMIGGPSADRLGRRKALILWSAIYAVGVVIQFFSVDKWFQIAIGRFVSGLGVGSLSVLVPLYTSELAPKKIRGILVATLQLTFTFGIFLSYIVNWATKQRQGATQWRIPISLCLFWAAVLGIGMCFVPEAPRQLYMDGKYDECKKVLAKIRGLTSDENLVQEDYNDLEKTIETEQKSGKGSWKECFTGEPRMCYRTVLGMTIQSVGQLSGASFFWYYGVNLFSTIGMGDAFVTQITIGGLLFFSTIGVVFLIDRYGRRNCLFWGAAWCSVMLVIFSTLGLNMTQNDGTNNPKIASAMICFVCLYILGYATTWGPCAFVVISETYPFHLRARCMSIATGCSWLWNIFIALFSKAILNKIKYSYGFLFAGANIIGCITVYFFLYETKALTLEQVNEMYMEPKLKPWQSHRWIPARGEMKQNKTANSLPSSSRNSLDLSYTDMELEKVVSEN
ncbi:Hexose transporter 2 [Neolecta irregularis DAH-3]|uniref:Hexose transporter 2 n=1 Tax=Neolecta irregularis (strain DAH-3) TaxID=1198029 RepID=A0A1U7LUK8_NEOID|nr:Hexose transporter 2 [Neolecta irregularis DAH-3]|eukprot:OLL26298.1 Hexose transporter 2 [Neolecta irregularis DAH-3]